jgi:hypothetical protein
METTGNITKSLKKYLSNILGFQEIKKLKKTATLGIAHVGT